MEKKIIVVIRVDSSRLIGSGHLMRCLALAERYRREGHEVNFICRDLAGNMAELVKAHRFPLHMLLRAADDASLRGYEKWLTVSQQQDAAETIEIVQKLGKVDRLVVDSYAIDCTWEKILRPYVGEIMVIDDLANRHHDCNILLDQNFYLDKDVRYKDLVPSHCRLLLGPRHALLRDEFFTARKHLRKRDGFLRNILVFYGGVDATGETEKAVQALSLLRNEGMLQEVKVTIIVGAGNERKDKIAMLCHKAGYHYLEQVSNMAELMSEADLMLGAGGSTTWERCFLGLPAIVTAVAENQFKICEDCSQAGLIHYIGKWFDVTTDDLIAAIRHMVEPDNLRGLISTCQLDIGRRPL